MTTSALTPAELETAEAIVVKLGERLRADESSAEEGARLHRQAHCIVAVLRQGQFQRAQHQLRMLRRRHEGAPWSSKAAFNVFIELLALWRGCMARLMRETHPEMNRPEFANSALFKFDLEPHAFFRDPNACQRLFPQSRQEI